MSATDALTRLHAQVDFALVNVPPFDAASGDRPLPALDLRLAELTAEFTMATFDLPLGAIGFADSHDAALAKGARDFCLIQKVGHLFHGPTDTVAKALLDALDDCAFLTGHIMERGGYYYLHDQCVLVNRRAWERIGRPAFGTPASGAQRAAVPRRSPDNVHDDYTPLFLDPTGEEREWQGAFGYGWQSISASLGHGLRVTNWGDEPRRFKRNCYAYYGDPTEWQRTLADVPAAAPTADEGLREITEFLKAVAARTQARQTVPVDIPHWRLKSGLDHVLAPASSTDADRILDDVGVHPATAVTFYAADEAALEAQRRTLPEANERVRYVIADPVSAPENFAALCEGENVAVSLGTLFNDFPAIVRFDGARRRKAFETIRAALKTRAHRYLILGQPPYQRIRGI